MKILLTGILTPMIWGMVDRLSREGHQVSLLGRGISPVPPQTKAVLHDIRPSHPDALQVLESGRFDAIVFFYAYQCEDNLAFGSVQGSMLDVLFQFSHTASSSGVEKFILVTDLRVFSSGQNGYEEETPIPDTQTGILIKAAEDCLRFTASENMEKLLVRVPSLYAPGTEDAFFSRALKSSQNDLTFQLSGPPETPCDFLHVDDFALFLTLALEKRCSGIVHLYYGEEYTYADAASKIQQYLPSLKISYLENSLPRPRLQSRDTKAGVNWIPRHRWISELDEIFTRTSLKKEDRNFFKWIRGNIRRIFGKAIPWIEMILFAAITEGLLRMTDNDAMFRFVDYWLFYVILMGTLHGAPFGTMAGMIACIGYAASWRESGRDLYLLLYNMDNWLPLLMYLLSGGLFGFLHDRTAETMTAIQIEKEQRVEETEFIETMLKRVDADRNSLQEQVVRYRDSYGRIYAITQELDTLQPEQVFLSTLGILEDVMQNKSVALYSCSSSSSFARMVVHSRELINLPKSIDMDKMPQMRESINRGEMFANKQLIPGYPTFCTPIMQNDHPIAVITLWEVPFEQQTLYHQNLLNVVSGLVQSAMIRALYYFGTNPEIYINDTHIMTAKAFRSTISVYSKMRRQRASSYLLLSINNTTDNYSIRELDQRIGRAIRSTDIAGQLENGSIYVMLPQATLDNFPQIEKRFLSAGLTCSVTSMEFTNV